MSNARKANQSYLSRERQYYERTRWAGFEKRVDSTPDHRDSEEGLTGEGMPAWHGDGSTLSRTEWEKSGHGLRKRRRLHRSRTAERIITASSDSAIHRFVRHQEANRFELEAARATKRGVIRQLWRSLRRR